jgi:DNA topoisomerase IB
VHDDATLERIRALAIPPAWADVWICADPNGHLQATGIDAAGRKQYRYHDAWRARRDRQKFDDMIAFARALPRLRRRVTRDLRGDENGDGPGRERVLACAARMLDLGFFRIGSESYAEGNGSYGLATIRKPHVRVTDHGVVFDYPAKSGQRRMHEIADPDVRAIVAALKRRRGGPDELLAYRAGRRWVDVRSDDINDYLKDRSGTAISAKDFRTWNGTVLAAVALAELAGRPAGKTARKRAVSAAVKQVALYLGNTPAVARSSYIDPRVVDRFQDGQTIAPLHKKGRMTIEKAVLDLIDG